MSRILLATSLTLLLTACASAQVADNAVGTDAVASATLMDANGVEVGTAELVQTPANGVLIRLDVRDLEPGEHGFHIHETGQCTAPEFTSAGGHFVPRDHAHGMLHERGMHAGDMPNLRVPPGGAVQAEVLAEHVSLVPGAVGFLLDDDGSALVIHAGADDYRSQPSGDAGARVACGVIEGR